MNVIKIGMRVHWENYVDWVEGTVIEVEIRNENMEDEICECCGGIIEANYKQYKVCKVIS